MLKYPPLKPQKIPESLIYKRLLTEPVRRRFSYRYNVMFSTKTGKKQAIMSYVPTFSFPKGKPVKSLYISYLYSFESGHGYGTKMLNFARNCSIKEGCGGRFHLDASISLLPQKVPHIFYRKYGMTTYNKKLDKKIDKFIKQGKTATSSDFSDIAMYYNPQENNKKSQLRKLLNKLKIWFGANKS